jgi:hypothetical protein
MNDQDDAEREARETERWLRGVYENWTTSSASPEAHKFRGDFEGFRRGFTGQESGVDLSMDDPFDAFRKIDPKETKHK